ncbi:MAG: ABC transporter permease [Paracoccaceae bacterium]|nr:MAG: ABC transporter permease [Paracoccaceae bacterium]
MQGIRRVPTLLGGALRLIEVLKATVVHVIRQETGRSALGFVSAMTRPLILLATFMVIIEVMGVRGIAIRGNTVTFLMTGIICFLTHVTAVQKVAAALRKARGFMHHAPASLALFVFAQAVGALYLNLLAGLGVWLVAELSGHGLGILHPAGMILPYLLSWASGVGVGMILLALSHHAPTAAEVTAAVYTRVQFFTCGKFWAANIMPIGLVDYAVWNPLLHTIDQMRGAAFVNYTPQHTELGYPAIFTAVVLVIGFMLEWRLRHGLSLSALRR